MPAYSSFPEKILILTAIIIALSMCEFWVLLYLFPILTATVRNSITLILHINWDTGRLRYLFHGQWKWNVSRSVMSNSVISWTVACQAPPSVEFSRQEYWSRLPFPSPRNLPDPGIKPRSLGQIRSDQISRSVVSDFLWPHELQHARPPCPSPTLRVHSDSRPSSQWCHPTISSSVVPFSSCPNPSQHQSLFQWVNSSHEVAKVLEFQL